MAEKTSLVDAYHKLREKVIDDARDFEVKIMEWMSSI